MSSHGHGNGMRSVSTTVPLDVHAELYRRARLGHWRSLGSYIRVVLEQHVAQRSAIGSTRTLYTIPNPTPVKAAEPRNIYIEHPPFRTELAHRNNGRSRA